MRKSKILTSLVRQDMEKIYGKTRIVGVKNLGSNLFTVYILPYKPRKQIDPRKCEHHGYRVQTIKEPYCILITVKREMPSYVRGV